MKAVQLALRFVLEVCALAALGYSGWHIARPVWLRLLVAVALPLVAAIVWGRWVAPKASHPVSDPLRLIPEWVVFGGAAVALAVIDHLLLAALLAVAAGANRFALYKLGLTVRETSPRSDYSRLGQGRGP
jgi:hypothetical protein